jgi:hypothetical protein
MSFKTATEDSYWERSERFDMVACLNLGQPLIDAFCRVLERWIAHFTSASVRIVTARDIEDSNWVWHVGLGCTGQQHAERLVQRPKH